MGAIYHKIYGKSTVPKIEFLAELIGFYTGFYLVFDDMGVSISMRMIQNQCTVFRRVVTTEQAYTIGFIAMGGSIDNGILRIVYKDDNVLEELQSRMFAKNKINNNILTISCIPLCNCLKKYGITSGVFSNKILPPNFKKRNLILSYICGMYDARGYLSWIKKGKYFSWTISFTGSYIMMLWISQQLDRFDIAKFKKPEKTKNKKDLYCLKYLNQTEVNSIIVNLRRLGVHLIKRKWYVKDYNKSRGIVCVPNESKFYNF